MRPTLALCAFLMGLEACGGRTVSDDYRDAGPAVDGPLPGDDAGPGSDVVPRVDVVLPGDVGPGCLAPRRVCQGQCVDVRNDPRHCGACGIFCGGGQTCAAGRCQGGCPDGQVSCAGACVDLGTDPRHCGACGLACPSGRTCVQGACRPSTMMVPFGGAPFRVEALTAAGCETTEHASVTGDDRGGIAASVDEVFYTGDQRTGRFPVGALPMASPLSGRYDALVSDLGTGTVYTFFREGRPFDFSSIPDGSTEVVFDALIPFGPGGVLGAARIPLSQPVRVSLRQTVVGIYAGVGRVVIHDDRTLHHIALPGGVVTSVPFTSILPRTRCESWATWGIAEYAGDTLSLVYVENGQRVARYNTRTGAVTTAAAFQSLSDMCSITALPQRGLWAFHHEGRSQFASGDETVGTCMARFRFE